MRKSIILLATSTWLSIGEPSCSAEAAPVRQAAPQAAVLTGQASPSEVTPVHEVTEAACSASGGGSLPAVLLALGLVLRRRRAR